MKVILLNTIKGLGSYGSEVIVKSGYARNFLIPQFKAVLATKENLKFFQERYFQLKSDFEQKQLESKLCLEAINKLNNITISARSSIRGKLFGSIGSKDIAQVITESIEFKINKSQIRLPNCDSLKFIGSYKIKIHIYKEMYANLIVNITSITS